MLGSSPHHWYDCPSILPGNVFYDTKHEETKEIPFTSHWNGIYFLLAFQVCISNDVKYLLLAFQVCFLNT